MKELFNILSTVSGFFTEKRFVYQGPEKPPPPSHEPIGPEEKEWSAMGKAERYKKLAEDLTAASKKIEESRKPGGVVREAGREQQQGEGGKPSESEVAKKEREENERGARKAIDDYFEDPDNNRSMWTKGAKGMLDKVVSKWESYKRKIINVIAKYRANGMMEAARKEQPKKAGEGAGPADMEVREQGAIVLPEGPEIFQHFQKVLKKNRQLYERSSVEYYAYDKYDLDDKANAVVSNVISKILPDGDFEHFVKEPIKTELMLASGRAPRRKRRR